MNGELYREILADELMRTMSMHDLGLTVIFQHDNDPKHAAHETKRWLSEHRIKVLDWPAYSPDLNPIEHLWNEMDHRLRKLLGIFQIKMTSGIKYNRYGMRSTLSSV